MARKSRDYWEDEEEAAEPVLSCWLCSRPMGEIVEWHHPVPKSRGGREKQPIHPICHQAVHNNFTNSELEKRYATRRSAARTMKRSGGLSTGSPTNRPIFTRLHGSDSFILRLPQRVANPAQNQRKGDTQAQHRREFVAAEQERQRRISSIR